MPISDESTNKSEISAEQIAKLESDLNNFSQEVSRQSFDSRVAQIDSLSNDGAKPHRVFVSVVGEYTRADNIYCGINGEASHKAMSQYFEKALESESDEQMRLVLETLKDRSLEMEESRKLVKEFLLLDQLTDASNYAREINSVDSATYFNSSLYDIPSRITSEKVNNLFLQKLEQALPILEKWPKLAEDYETLGIKLLPFINPAHPQAYENVIRTGNRDPEVGLNWKESLTHITTTANEFAEFLEKGERDDELYNETLNSFMLRLTAAEGLLEAQYYYVGVGMLRAAASGKLKEVLE